MKKKIQNNQMLTQYGNMWERNSNNNNNNKNEIKQETKPTVKVKMVEKFCA